MFGRKPLKEDILTNLNDQIDADVLEKFLENYNTDESV
jgi:hypothetical protein